MLTCFHNKHSGQSDSCVSPAKAGDTKAIKNKQKFKHKMAFLAKQPKWRCDFVAFTWRNGNFAFFERKQLFYR